MSDLVFEFDDGQALADLKILKNVIFLPQPYF